MKGWLSDYQKITNKIIKFIQDKTVNKEGVVLGVSGGVDSAVVLALCIRALGKDKVKALLMHETKEEVNALLKKYLNKLKVKYELIPIKPIYDSFIKHGNLKKDRLVLGNLKARIRMSLLYTRSNANNLLVMGTGNKSELMTGYFTKHGDAGIDFLPIGDLYKTQVKELASVLGVPTEITNQIPTAGLWGGQSDEEELGISYYKLDVVLFEYLDRGIPFSKIHIKGVTKEEVGRVKNRIEENSYKINPPQICQIQ